MESLVEIITALVILVVTIVFTSQLIAGIIVERIGLRNIKKFKEDFKEAIKHSQPSFEEIKEIASTRTLTQAKIQHVLKSTKREILTGRNKDLEPHKEIIQGYLERLQKDEPFEGLPNEVRIHLERLRGEINVNEGLLEPLTTQIKELLLINDREKKKQKYYTVAGFFVGLLGLAFALFVYFK